jgi:hypothetical protein
MALADTYGAMTPSASRVGFVLAGVLFYALVAAGASIYGSYRSEPSGIQYWFLPNILAPLVGIVAIALFILGKRVGAGIGLRLAGLVAVAMFALPPTIMRLSNRNLEFWRLATIAFGVLHVVAFAYFVRRSVAARRTG